MLLMVALSKNPAINTEALIRARRAEMAVVLNNQGLNLKEGKNIDQAIDCYRQATRCAPDCAGLWFNLGSNPMIKNKFEEAVDARRSADEKAQDAAKARTRLDRLTLRAPVGGAVQALTVTNTGK
jgi:tetratricopeptide (TPR) repeat protein